MMWSKSFTQICLLAHVLQSTLCTVQIHCASPANKIVAENCKAGVSSTTWDVNGAGDPSIQGFSTDISVNLAETIYFKIKTPADKWRVDIFRLGYYNGTGARLVDTVKPIVNLPQIQPACIKEESTHLIDCGTWAVSAQWNVPKEAISGLYVARPVREDTVSAEYVKGGQNWRTDNSYQRGDRTHAKPGDDDYALPKKDYHAYGATGFGKLRNPIKEPRASHIYFVVRDDSSASEILFQTADTTWQAYNGYGGLTTYGSFVYPFTHGPDPQPMDITLPHPRAFKASYNRPTITRGYRAVNAPLNSEYPAIRFLEAAGYDVSYFTGVDAARNGHLIQKHKLYLSVGHDEYVSYEQRAVLEEARDNGVNLAFLSGNEFYWAVRFENSTVGSNHAGYRTMVCYKESQSNEKLDPLPGAWTGTFRDNRPTNPVGSMPENALTGTIFTVNAQRVDSLQVPSAFSRLRWWKNTPVADLAAGHSYYSFPGVLGHEWDEDLDNGYRPEGQIRLSDTIVNNVQYIHDHGSVFDTGSGRHNLVLYKSQKSKAIVFGAGTVQWVWGLDNHHDVNDPPRANKYATRLALDPLGPDLVVQQLTVNIFAAMGVNPTTLDQVRNVARSKLVLGEGLTDNTPPTVQLVKYTSKDQSRVVVSIAAEDDGGVVASVEVTLDGGSRWHPAERVGEDDTHWQYVYGEEEYQLFYFGYDIAQIDVGARAIDDSLNIGKAEFASGAETCDDDKASA